MHIIAQNQGQCLYDNQIMSNSSKNHDELQADVKDIKTRKVMQK